MDNTQLQLVAASIVSGLVHLIVLIASIIMFAKKRTIATIVLLLGSVLTSIGFIGGFIYNAIAARNGTEALLDAQVTLTFFNAFSFFIFGIGLFLLALNFNKKN
ncbi:hypothetical protein [Wocania ichthyoenteri]|uniref:hypothetical protein n=1 Tax=Wocania ichthyoenteri TaxID=1230531 RepID=UPI00053E47F2|nr:hypothetical protein [Wocania ichthyoenteri]